LAGSAAYDAASNYASEVANAAVSKKRERSQEASPGELQNRKEEVARKGNKKAGQKVLEGEAAWRRLEEARRMLREAGSRQGLHAVGRCAAGEDGEAGEAVSRQELLAAELRAAGEGGFACWTEARRRQAEAR
jgi:hypothetical protein